MRVMIRNLTRKNMNKILRRKISLHNIFVLTLVNFSVEINRYVDILFAAKSKFHKIFRRILELIQNGQIRILR